MKKNLPPPMLWLLTLLTRPAPQQRLDPIPNLLRTPPAFPHVIHNGLRGRGLTQTSLRGGEIPSASRLSDAVFAGEA